MKQKTLETLALLRPSILSHRSDFEWTIEWTDGGRSGMISQGGFSTRSRARTSAERFAVECGVVGAYEIFVEEKKYTDETPLFPCSRVPFMDRD